MKKSYSALYAVSIIFSVLGYIIVFVGILFCLFVLNSPPKEGETNYYNILIFIGTIFTTFLSSITFWAASQFIKLCINVANDIHNVTNDIHTINENAFYIADILAKKQV